MSSLAGTTWTVKMDGGDSTVKFDKGSTPPGTSGGTGTMTGGGAQTPIVWVESGPWFMFQLQDQSPEVSTLTTYAGGHQGGVGSVWMCNFNINFALQLHHMTKNA